MSNTTYHELPLDTLYELLTINIREMLQAIDTNQDKGIAHKVKRKQAEIMLAEIEEKNGMKLLVQGT
jgi:hypothetical protein